MRQRALLYVVLAAISAVACCLTASAAAQDDADTAAIRAADDELIKAFNAGKVDALAAMFLPKGELIDEQGNAHEGQAAIKALLTKFFEKFPGAKLTHDIDSIRVIGPVAIEEGTRTIVTKDQSDAAQVNYIMIRTKIGNGWQIVSLRDYSDDADLTPNDRLQPLAPLVGDWVNEGNDAAVRISYRWSEDKNFLLGDFHVTKSGSTVMQSTQRIGFDPLAGKIRSWMFDSDGGFGEGLWTHLADGSWVIKSTAVLPDGQTGSATITLKPIGKDRYTLKGTDRIAGDERDEDYEYIVSRRPPMPNK